MPAACRRIPTMIGLDEKTKAWLAIRKDAARDINPATAEICWTYGQVMDPYRIKQLSAEYDCVGRNYFARAPGSDVWVSFDDLPESAMHCGSALLPKGRC